MLKFLFISIASVLALGFATPNSSQNFDKNEPNNAAMTAVSSYTSTVNKYYESSSDVFVLAPSNMSDSIPNWAENTAPTYSNNTMTLKMGERSGISSGKWHAMYKEYTFAVSVPANADARITFTYSLTTYNDSSAGQADHTAEFMFLGTSNADPTLYSGSNKSTDNHTITSTCTAGGFQVRRVTKHGPGTESISNQTMTHTSTNTTSAVNNVTYRVGFYAYIEESNTDHNHTATFTLNTDVTYVYYDCKYSLTGNSNVYYDNFTNSFNTVNSSANGGSITLLRNVSLSSGYIVQKNTTVYLEGFNLSRNINVVPAQPSPYNSIFNVYPGISLTITSNSNRGGKLSSNYAFMVINIAHNDNGGGGSVTISGGVTIENTWPGPGSSGHGIIADCRGATVTTSNCSIVTASNPQNATTSGILLRKGSTANIGASTVFKSASSTSSAGYSFAVRSDNGTDYVDNIYFSGNVNFGTNNDDRGRVGISSLSKANIYLYKGSTSWSCTGANYRMSIQVSDNSLVYNATVAYGFSGQASNYVGNNWLDLASGIASYLLLQKSGNNYVIGYRNYTINFHLSNLTKTGGGSTASGSRASNFITNLTPQNSEFYTFASTITVKRGTTDLTAGTHYTYDASTGKLTILAATFDGSEAFHVYADGVLTDAGKANNFVTNYLYMNSYTTDQGRCLDSSAYHYYSSAKTALLNYGSGVINAFRSSDTFAAARARYEAWAAANHDAHPYENIPYSGIQTSRLELNSSNYYVIIVVSVAIMGVALLYLRTKKRKDF